MLSVGACWDLSSMRQDVSFVGRGLDRGCCTALRYTSRLKPDNSGVHSNIVSQSLWSTSPLTVTVFPANKWFVLWLLTMGEYSTLLVLLLQSITQEFC